MERMGYEEFFAHPFLSAALIPLGIAPATPYPAASAPTRAHVSEKGGVGGAAVGWAGAGGGITLCPIVSLPSRSPSPRAWAVGAGVGGGVAGLVASSPSSDSIQRSGSPGQGTGKEGGRSWVGMWGEGGEGSQLKRLCMPILGIVKSVWGATSSKPTLYIVYGLL